MPCPPGILKYVQLVVLLDWANDKCMCTLAHAYLIKSVVEILTLKKSLWLVAIASLYVSSPRRVIRDTAGLLGTSVMTWLLVAKLSRLV